MLLSSSALSGDDLEEIVVTGSRDDSGPDYYITDRQTDWVRDMNYRQYLRDQADENQKRSEAQQRYENERSLARCKAGADDTKKTCVFKANDAARSNMARCDQLTHGLSATIVRAGGFTMEFSASDSYDHCVNMAEIYRATDISGCKAIAAAEINRCEQAH